MALTRQFIFAVDPAVGLVSTYSFAAIPDGNASQKAFSCAYAPRSKGNTISGMNDSVFLGTINVGKSYRAFREDLATDDGSNFTAEAITARLDPTLVTDEDSDKKRYLHIECPDINPPALGLTMQFAKDVHDPQITTPTWNSFSNNVTNRTKYGLPSGVARWLHVRIVDATARVSRLVFGGFKLNYYDLFSRQEED